MCVCMGQMILQFQLQWMESQKLVGFYFDTIYLCVCISGWQNAYTSMDFICRLDVLQTECWNSWFWLI